VGRAVEIVADLGTGALVLTAERRCALCLIPELVNRVTAAIRQRPAAVVVDLSRLPVRWCLPALAVGLARRRHGVRVLACAPRGVRMVFNAVPGVRLHRGALPALSTLPGYRVPAQKRIRLRLTPTVHAPRMARSLVARAVSTWAEPLAQAAQIIVSELVSNAVEHARTEVDLHVTQMRDGVCIAVHDEDPTPPASARNARGRAEGVALRGRGIPIVARVAHSWGYLTGTSDKVVWAALHHEYPGRLAS
jgi:anti-sigma regulatory factor (Ser/Thr protein kinase)